MPPVRKTRSQTAKEARKTALAQRKGSLANPLPYDVNEQARTLVEKEKRVYEDANRTLKNTIRRAYKNYLGIYDEPLDQYTQRRKIFTPLTHDIVDGVSKPVSISSKAIKIVPMTEQSRAKAKALNMMLPYFFQLIDFDGFLEEFKQRVVWLGTSISVQDWLYEEMEEATSTDATTKQLNDFAEQDEKEIKKEQKTRKVKSDRPRIRMVNPMDVFLPATAESITWAIRNASVIVRSTATLESIQSNPLYNDAVKASITGRYIDASFTVEDSTSLNRYSMGGYGAGEAKVQAGSAYASSGAANVISIYERYGKIPKSWLTNKQEDAFKMIDGRITCAASGPGENVLETLCVTASPFGEYGPFEDCRFSLIPNRYYGEGIGERLIAYQMWHNEIVNNRRNNEILVQHKMFIYRKGKVDPKQFFARPGGGIAVEDMNDVSPLVTPDVAASSFNEDTYIISAAQRLAGVALTPLQKKATATEIENIQANSNLTSNELMRALERYLERLVLHHLIPLLKRYFKEKRIIPVDIGADDLTVLDTYNGYAPFDSQMMGEQRFIFIDDPSIFDGEFAVTVDIESTGTNKAQKVAAITNLISLASKVQNAGLNIPNAVKKIAELSGIHDDRLFEAPAAAMPTGMTSPNLVQPNAPPGPQPMTL